MGDTIPIIDFSKVAKVGWENLSCDDWALLTGQLYEAVSKMGFVYIVNHGISQDKIDAAFVESLKFFNLPDQIKESHTLNKQGNFRGYTKPGEKIENFPTVVESFFIETPEESYTIPQVPQFVPTLETLRIELQPIARILFILAGKCLKLKDEKLFFNAYNKGEAQQKPVNTSTMRCNYYPEIPKDVEIPKGFVRAVEHKDWGHFTLLFQDDIGGLEVESVDGRWIKAKPLAGSILVNTGKIMGVWTGGVFRATPHRVLMPECESQKRLARQSVVFFVNIDSDLVMGPLESELIDYTGKEFEPFKFKDYYESQLSSSYRKDD